MIQNFNRFKLVFALATVVVGMSSTGSFAAQGVSALNVSDNDSCPAECGVRRTPLGGGSSGHSPGGLFSDRILVELAEGEDYQLAGTVTLVRGAPYLAVNLDIHPWLATDNRRQFPFYALEGDMANWLKWVDKKVVLTVEAHGKIVEHVGNSRYEISLKLLREPSSKFKY